MRAQENYTSVLQASTKSIFALKSLAQAQQTNSRARMSTESCEVKYSNYACRNCRESHRKCDKKLDTCSYCQKTNKKCIYIAPPARKSRKRKPETTLSSDDLSHCEDRVDEPEKKRQKRVELLSEMELSVQSIIEEYKKIIPSDICVSESMNAYYSLFSTGFPLIECELGLQVMELVNKHSSTGMSNSGTKPLDIPSLFSFIAVQILSLQRLGRRKLAYQLYCFLQPLLAREIYTSSADSSSSKFLTTEGFNRMKLLSCTLATLAYYASGSVGNDATRLIVHTGRFMLQRLRVYYSDYRFSTTTGSSILCDKLEVYFMLAEFTVIQHGDNIADSFKSLLSTAAARFPYGESNTLKYLSSIDNLDMLSVLNTSERITDNSIRMGSEFLQPMVVELLRVAFNLSHTGLKIICMSTRGDMLSDLVQLANTQSDMIASQLNVFQHCPPFVIKPVALISKIHLQYTSDKKRIEQDLKAMRILSERYDIVANTEKYSNLIAELEKSCSNKNEQSHVVDFLDVPATLPVDPFLSLLE